jgi:hypothetical protein
MGPPSCTRSVVDRNVLMRHIPVVNGGRGFSYLLQNLRFQYVGGSDQDGLQTVALSEMTH